MASTCIVCGSTETFERYPDELAGRLPTLDYAFSPSTRLTFRIAECRLCTHQYVDPMPQIADSYGDVVDQTYLNSRRQRIRTAQTLLRRVRGHLNVGDRLLDVGCNSGFFLDVASQYFTVEGVELSTWAFREASKSHVIYNVPLSMIRGHSRYDIVTLIGVIEHFEDPASELGHIARLLDSDGTLVVFTGTRDSWLPRLLGKKWWWYQGMHLQYFTRSSLARALESNDFDIVKRFTHTSWFSLASLYQSALRYPMGRILASPLRLPFVRQIMIPLRISGETVVVAKRRNIASQY